jgi:hypothetical protein
MNRNRQLGAGLDLAHGQHAIADVLPTHPNNIRSPQR